MWGLVVGHGVMLGLGLGLGLGVAGYGLWVSGQFRVMIIIRGWVQSSIIIHSKVSVKNPRPSSQQ